MVKANINEGTDYVAQQGLLRARKGATLLVARKEICIHLVTYSHSLDVAIDNSGRIMSRPELPAIDFGSACNEKRTV